MGKTKTCNMRSEKRDANAKSPAPPRPARRSSVLLPYVVLYVVLPLFQHFLAAVPLPHPAPFIRTDGGMVTCGQIDLLAPFQVRDRHWRYSISVNLALSARLLVCESNEEIGEVSGLQPPGAFFPAPTHSDVLYIVVERARKLAIDIRQYAACLVEGIAPLRRRELWRAE